MTTATRTHPQQDLQGGTVTATVKWRAETPRPEPVPNLIEAFRAGVEAASAFPITPSTREAAVNELLEWAFNHDPDELEAAREDAWRRD